jgi:hypothetical protein
MLLNILISEERLVKSGKSPFVHGRSGVSKLYPVGPGVKQVALFFVHRVHVRGCQMNLVSLNDVTFGFTAIHHSI